MSQKFLRRIRSGRTGAVGLTIVVFYLLISVFGPFATPYDPVHQDLVNSRALPSLDHLFGTDELGRDILTRVLYGGRLAFFAGLSTIGFALALGLSVGLIAGFQGGKFDEAIMRVIDLMLSLPYFLMALAIVTLLGPSLTNAMVALGLWMMPIYARLVRALTIRIKEEQYIEAAVMSGEKDRGIILHYVLPNCISPIIVQSTLDIPRVILSLAALSFLGLGAQPPTPEWGLMITSARTYINVAPHIVLIPGMVLFFLVLGFNFLGDGLRDALDPRLHMTVKA